MLTADKLQGYKEAITTKYSYIDNKGIVTQLVISGKDSNCIITPSNLSEFTSNIVVNGSDINCIVSGSNNVSMEKSNDITLLASKEALRAKSILKVFPCDNEIIRLARKHNVLDLHIRAFIDEFKRVWHKQDAEVAKSTIQTDERSPAGAAKNKQNLRMAKPAPTQKNQMTENEVIKTARHYGYIKASLGQDMMSEEALKKAAANYGIHQSTYIHYYKEGFNRKRNTMTEIEVITKIAKKNGRTLAEAGSCYIESHLREKAKKYGENASIFYNAYVSSFNKQSDKMSPEEKSRKRAQENERKKSTYKSKKITQHSTQPVYKQQITQILDIQDSFSSTESETEFDKEIDLTHPLLTEFILDNQSNKAITSQFTCSKSISDSESSDYSSDSEEEFSANKIRQLNKRRDASESELLIENYSKKPRM